MNMSYCRFQNTLDDLKDCWEHIDENTELSESELKARLKLIKLCKRIADNCEDELEEINS
jgi:hypothetical protein